MQILLFSASKGHSSKNTQCFLCSVCRLIHGRIQRGGDRGSGPPPPPWNCQIINFCHVEIFRQTPSGNLDPPPPPLRKFSGSAHVILVINHVKLHQEILNGYQVTERTRLECKFCYFPFQRVITPKYAIQSYGSCVLHAVLCWFIIL